MNSVLYITNWILWSVCLFCELMFLVVRVLGADREPPVESPGGQFPIFPLALGIFGLFTAGLLLLQRFLLRKNARAARIWEWPISILLYFFVVFTMGVSFPRYFSVGKSDQLSWWGLAVGAVFLLLTLPAWQERWAEQRYPQGGGPPRK